MIYNNLVKQDGQIYMPGENIPDLGTIRCVESKGNLRQYEALSSDFEKLPHYVSTGSSCLMIDTGDLYKFEKSTDTWYKI